MSGDSVYWDIYHSFSPHILIVGPTGSGKTIALASLAKRMVINYGGSLIILDIKDEYQNLLSLLFRDANIIILDPLRDSLPLCFCSSTVEEKRQTVSSIVNLVSRIFSLTATSSRLIQNFLLDVCIRCTDISDIFSQNFDIYDKNLDRSIDTVTRIFNVYPDTASAKSYSLFSRDIYLFNLRKLFLIDKADSATAILYIIYTILNNLKLNTGTKPRAIVALDELWHIIPYAIEDLIDILTRYGRGLGLSLMMATQNIDDLTPYTDTIVNNCGGFIAMSSSTLSYWRRLRAYLNLSNKSLTYVATISNQGEAIARFSPWSKPIFLYIDPFDEE